jgi:hypothetical protein
MADLREMPRLEFSRLYLGAGLSAAVDQMLLKSFMHSEIHFRQDEIVESPLFGIDVFRDSAECRRQVRYFSSSMSFIQYFSRPVGARIGSCIVHRQSRMFVLCGVTAM